MSGGSYGPPPVGFAGGNQESIDQNRRALEDRKEKEEAEKERQRTLLSMPHRNQSYPRDGEAIHVSRIHREEERARGEKQYRKYEERLRKLQEEDRKKLEKAMRKKEEKERKEQEKAQKKQNQRSFF